jgi:very-short-patch-repair endonuclease/putative sterol carrier protein
MSLPEVKLWALLRRSPSGIRFRRQHPVGPYVADFYCPAAKLIIEIDGISHDLGDRPALDLRRDNYVRQLGLSVLRIPAADVLNDVTAVADGLIALCREAVGPPPLSCAERSPSPPLRGREDEPCEPGGVRLAATSKRRTAMTKSELVAKMQDAGAWLPGKTVKIDFGDEGAILLDGANSLVTENDGAADTTIKVSWDDWQALSSGQLDGMTAFMTGKLKVEGDMSNAMQLQSVLGKLRG